MSVRAIYLTARDRKALQRTVPANATPLSYEGMPIISEGLLYRLGLPVPAVSTIYEIEAVG
jgi:hypothetical protein